MAIIGCTSYTDQSRQVMLLAIDLLVSLLMLMLLMLLMLAVGVDAVDAAGVDTVGVDQTWKKLIFIRKPKFGVEKCLQIQKDPKHMKVPKNCNFFHHIRYFLAKRD